MIGNYDKGCFDKSLPVSSFKNIEDIYSDFAEEMKKTASLYNLPSETYEINTPHGYPGTGSSSNPDYQCRLNIFSAARLLLGAYYTPSAKAVLSTKDYYGIKHSALNSSKFENWEFNNKPIEILMTKGGSLVGNSYSDVPFVNTNAPSYNSSGYSDFQNGCYTMGAILEYDNKKWLVVALGLPYVKAKINGSGEREIIDEVIIKSEIRNYSYKNAGEAFKEIVEAGLGYCLNQSNNSYLDTLRRYCGRTVNDTEVGVLSASFLMISLNDSYEDELTLINYQEKQNQNWENQDQSDLGEKPEGYYNVYFPGKSYDKGTNLRITASYIKVLTLLTLIPKLQNYYTTVQEVDKTLGSGSRKPGDKKTIEELVYYMCLESDNTATTTLAREYLEKMK